MAAASSPSPAATKAILERLRPGFGADRPSGACAGGVGQLGRAKAPGQLAQRAHLGFRAGAVRHLRPLAEHRCRLAGQVDGAQRFGDRGVRTGVANRSRGQRRDLCGDRRGGAIVEDRRLRSAGPRLQGRSHAVRLLVAGGERRRLGRVARCQLLRAGARERRPRRRACGRGPPRPRRDAARLRRHAAPAPPRRSFAPGSRRAAAGPRPGSLRPRQPGSWRCAAVPWRPPCRRRPRRGGTPPAGRSPPRRWRRCRAWRRRAASAPAGPRPHRRPP